VPTQRTMPMMTKIKGTESMAETSTGDKATNEPAPMSTAIERFDYMALANEIGLKMAGHGSMKDARLHTLRTALIAAASLEADRERLMREVEQVKAAAIRDMGLTRQAREQAERRAEALATAAKAVLEHRGGDGMHEDAHYCWWCDQNINGIVGEKEPHRDDCIGVKLRALIGQQE
jgi:hypothetical protein